MSGKTVVTPVSIVPENLAAVNQDTAPLRELYAAIFPADHALPAALRANRVQAQPAEVRDLLAFLAGQDEGKGSVERGDHGYFAAYNNGLVKPAGYKYDGGPGPLKVHLTQITKLGRDFLAYLDARVAEPAAEQTTDPTPAPEPAETRDILGRKAHKLLTNAQHDMLLRICEYVSREHRSIRMYGNSSVSALVKRGYIEPEFHAYQHGKFDYFKPTEDGMEYYREAPMTDREAERLALQEPREPEAAETPALVDVPDAITSQDDYDFYAAKLQTPALVYGCDLPPFWSGLIYDQPQPDPTPRIVTVTPIGAPFSWLETRPLVRLFDDPVADADTALDLFDAAELANDWDLARAALLYILGTPTPEPWDMGEEPPASVCGWHDPFEDTSVQRSAFF